MKLYTIGFTKKSAQSFFSLLREAQVTRLIDVRLKNISQLAGFAKRDDLAYFCNAICHIDYVHLPELTPTKDLLDAYKKRIGAWDTYEFSFNDLLKERRVEQSIPKELLNGGCLLCSEEKPDHCHRRLVAEYLRDKWGEVEIEHLL